MSAATSRGRISAKCVLVAAAALFAAGSLFAAVGEPGLFQNFYSGDKESSADPEVGGVIVADGAILSTAPHGNPTTSVTDSSGTTHTLGTSSTVGYKGVMKLTARTKYTFAKNFDDNGYVKIVTPDGITTNSIISSTTWDAVAYGSYTPTVTGWHTLFVYLGQGSGGIGPNTAPFNETPCASVLWNDVGLASCTTDNRSQWHRLVNDATEGTYLYTAVPPEDCVYVTGEPEQFGSPSPEYGMKEDVVSGTSYTFSMPQPVVTNDAKTVEWTCTGWTLVDPDGKETSGTTTEVEIDYAGGVWDLTWKWEKKEGYFGDTLNVPSAEYPTIAAAVGAAASGDIVSIAAGTYEITDWIVVDEAIAVVGAGRDSTVITNTTAKSVANRTGCVLYLNHADAVVKDVTLAGAWYSRGGTPYSGGWGAYVAAGTLADARVTNCRGGDSNQSGTDGAAVNVNGASAYVLRTIIANNTRKGWNTSVSAGLRIDEGTVADSLIVDNHGASGAGVYIVGKNSHLLNCTIVNNRVSTSIQWFRGGGLYSGVSSGSRIENCLFALNGGNDGGSEGGNEWYAENRSVLASAMKNCAVFGGAALGTDGIRLGVDPFVDAAHGDYRLRAGTPAVGAGCAHTGLSTTDLAGNPISAKPDIGCYARTTPGALSCAIGADRDALVVGTNIVFAALVRGTNGTETIDCEWTAKDSSSQVVDFGLAGSSPTATVTSVGTYTVTLRVRANGGSWTDGDEPFAFRAGPATLYVTNAANAKAAAPYDMPEKASDDAQTVIDSACPGAVVVFAPGTYSLKDDKMLYVTNAITVRGAGRDKTIIDDNGNRHFFINHGEAVVEGFTLKNASNPSESVAGYTDSVLGGWAAFVMTGTLRDSRITGCNYGYNNANRRNGAAVNLGSPWAYLSHCILDNNYRNGYNTAIGVALLLDGGQADNCLFYGNYSGIGVGACIATAGSRLLNCTFAKNQTRNSKTHGGGLYFANVANCRVENCLFALNESADTTSGGGEWYAEKDSTLDSAAKNCAVLNGATFGTDPVQLTADPFVDSDNDNYAVRFGMKSIGAGFLSDDLSALDLAGKPRVTDDKVDIGCYQYQSAGIDCGISVDKSAAFKGSTFGFSSVISGTNGMDVVSFAWSTKDAKGNSVDLGLSGANPVWISNRYGYYTVHLKIGVQGKWYDCADDLKVAVNVLTNYVTAAANPKAAYPWATEETAATNAQEVVDAGLAGGTIRFASGTYAIEEQILVEKALTLVGAGIDKSILSNATSTSVRLLCLNHKDCRAEGFTVMKGKGGDDQIPSGSLGKVCGGWGVHINAGTLAHSRVTECSGSWGNANSENSAAVNLQTSDAVLTHCIVDHNTRKGFNTAQGGGVRIVKGKMDNCFIYANVGAYGGGISLVGGGADVWNCTVVSNSCSNSGNSGVGGGIGGYGGYDITGSKVRNCVFAFNTSSKMMDDSQPGGGEWGYRSGSNIETQFANAIENCAFYSGPETGNAQPIGAGSFTIGREAFRNAARCDFRPKAGGPLVDKGAYADWMATATDLCGQPRATAKGTVDIGAYQANRGGLLLIVR